MKKIINMVSLASLMLLTSTLTGCKKLIEVDLPLDKNTSETVFSDISTAVPAVNAIYAILGSNDPFVGENGVSIRAGLMADELRNRIVDDIDYKNAYDGDGGMLWESSYRNVIYKINSGLEGVARSKSLSAIAKQRLSGELKFCRAWLYFLLVNFYGDVPLVLNTDLISNSAISRSPKDEVYLQIVNDLLQAKSLLSEDYLGRDLVNPVNDRIRPNRSSAAALLSRVYLHMGNWSGAEAEATVVISNPHYEILNDLEEVFLKNSRESIFQLQPGSIWSEGNNAPDGSWFINPYGGEEPWYVLSESLIDDFQSGDKRKLTWTRQTDAGTMSYKYKEGWSSRSGTEYTMVFRLAEQYLIRAEARLRLGKLAGSGSTEEDINVIRNRAGLLPITISNEANGLETIDQERRSELFLEWGDRWLNLKRRGTINAVMAKEALIKGSVWAPYKALLPIPFDEFKYNPAIRGNQNPGYREQK